MTCTCTVPAEAAAATIDALLKRLTFGRPTDIEWGSNDGSAADGGWINVTVPVALDGCPIGQALIGAWVYTDADGGPREVSSDIYDEARRAGWAVRTYRGNERILELTVAVADLVFVSDEDVTIHEIESAILDAADDSHDADYGEIFAAQLRERLADTERDSVYHLMRAVRALEG